MSVYRILICFVFMLVATGCGNSGNEAVNATGKAPAAVAGNASQESAAQQDASPQYGGRLVLGTIGDFSNMIPILTSDAGSHEIAKHLYVAPLQYDKNLEIEPWAAESYTVLDEGRRIRIVMRKDVFWEDGEQLTARDVEFTYRLMIDQIGRAHV